MFRPSQVGTRIGWEIAGPTLRGMSEGGQQLPLIGGGEASPGQFPEPKFRFSVHHDCTQRSEANKERSTKRHGRRAMCSSIPGQNATKGRCEHQPEVKKASIQVRTVQKHLTRSTVFGNITRNQRNVNQGGGPGDVITSPSAMPTGYDVGINPKCRAHRPNESK